MNINMIPKVTSYLSVFIARGERGQLHNEHAFLDTKLIISISSFGEQYYLFKMHCQIPKAAM